MLIRRKINRGLIWHKEPIKHTHAHTHNLLEQ